MSAVQSPPRPPPLRFPALLLGAAHPLPALAVTVLAGLLGRAGGLPAGRTALVVAATLTGQLSIGWSNDLVDLRRDRLAGRSDKPLVAGVLGVAAVRVACSVAVVLTVPLGLACGLAAGLVHVGCVAAAWAYNLGLKGTVWSWLPYALAFGGLTAFVSLADRPSSLPPLWQPVAGALLGVGAHLLNVLPDLEDDALTGVHGLPHRVGARWSPRLATVVLVAASVVIVLGSGPGVVPGAVALVLVAALALVTLTARGRAPFLAAIGIALADVSMLVLR